MITTKLVKLYQALADLTKPECALCRVPHSCCEPFYCDMAVEYTRSVVDPNYNPPSKDDKGLFLDESKNCKLAPHLRPLCTQHTCRMNSLGSLSTPAKTKKYFELMEAIDTELTKVEL